MAENIQGENSAQSGSAGHRTIKLTPMNVQTERGKRQHQHGQGRQNGPPETAESDSFDRVCR